MGALSDGTRYARAAQEEASILALSYLPTTDSAPGPSGGGIGPLVHLAEA